MKSASRGLKCVYQEVDVQDELELVFGTTVPISPGRRSVHFDLSCNTRLNSTQPKRCDNNRSLATNFAAAALGNRAPVPICSVMVRPDLPRY